VGVAPIRVSCLRSGRSDSGAGLDTETDTATPGHEAIDLVDGLQDTSFSGTFGRVIWVERLKPRVLSSRHVSPREFAAKKCVVVPARGSHLSPRMRPYRPEMEGKVGIVMGR
jgi:hypothetical protein